MRIAFAALLSVGFLTSAVAQNVTCPERPLADNSNACASTSYADRAASGAVTGAITGLTGDVAATGPGSVTATIQPGAVTSAKMGSGAAATNVGTLGGQLSGTLPNPNIAAATVTGANIASNTVANSNLANMQPGTRKCLPRGSSAGAPQDCPYLTFDVTDSPYGADPTGTTANFGTAFNAAMTACHAAAGGTRNNTVYIPQGLYKIGTTVPTMLSGCDLDMDLAAYVQANTAVTRLLNFPASSAVQYASIRGGNWDCNSNATDGWTLTQFFDVSVTDVNFFNCNSGSGGFMRLSGSGITINNGLYVKNVHMYNFGSQTPTLVSGNFGIFTDSASTGTANNFWDGIEIVGTSNCINGKFFSESFNKVHCWGFGSQGNAPNAIVMTGGLARFSQVEIDGPISTAAFNLSGSGSVYHIITSEYFEPTTNGLATAVLVGAGVQWSAIGMQIHGNSGATLIAADSNTLSGLVAAAGNTCLNVTATSFCSAASAANGLSLVGSAAGTQPFMKAGGSDTNINVAVQPKGTGAFTIMANGANNPVLAMQGSTSGQLFFSTGSTGGHGTYAFSGTAPTLTAGCNGAGSSISGTDINGTVGNQTAAATSCTVTFGTAFGAAPRCVVSGHQVAPTTVVPSTATLVINFASTAAAVFDWICFGT